MTDNRFLKYNSQVAKLSQRTVTFTQSTVFTTKICIKDKRLLSLQFIGFAAGHISSLYFLDFLECIHITPQNT